MLSKRSAVETSRGSVENKPNVSFPRDSSTTLGMTENKTLGMTAPCRGELEERKKQKTKQRREFYGLFN